MTILHLSDLQFGSHHRFNIKKKADVTKKFVRYQGDEAYNTLLNKLLEDLKFLKENVNLNIDVVVISGDLAEWSTQDEYKEVEKFIIGLIEDKKIGVSREHVIMVPGNHDVNWDLSEVHFARARGYHTHPKLPYAEKFEIWNNFFHGFYKDSKKDRTSLWYPYNLSEFGILIVGLNSCVLESHRKEDHYGYVGIEQIKGAIEWLNEADPRKELIRIAVFHHNLIGGSSTVAENLKDFEVISENLIEGDIDIVLHGHKHDTKQFTYGSLEKTIYALGTGSAGLDSDRLPDCPNKYQILDIKNGYCTLYLRRYSSRTISSSGSGCWEADADKKGEWIRKFELKKKEKSKVRESGVNAAVENIDLDVYVEAIYVNTLKQLASEKARVGELLQLESTDLDQSKRTPLLSVSIEWLLNEINQFVLLGDAGSGKTVFCLHFTNKCAELYRKNNINKIPILIDLKRYAGIDDALEILIRHLRENNIELSKEQIKKLLRDGRFIVILDAFDEYDKGSLSNVSDRSFDSFEYLCGNSTKLLITCRTTFFKKPEDIYLYDLKAHDFEFCPRNAFVQKISPLDKKSVSNLLNEYTGKIELPEWLLSLVTRPLFLRMIVPLLTHNYIDLSKELKRYELYERYVEYLLGWDIARRKRYSKGITFTKSLKVHTALAIQFLNYPSPSISETELGMLLQETLGCTQVDNAYEEHLKFFQLSSLLDHDSLGRIYFAHKSFREYLVARHIFENYIKLDDDTFDWIWFTRNERDFLAEIITEKEINTLRKWLKNEKKYPACNYAAFIIGGLNKKEEIPHLKEVFNNTDDSLVKLNCINSITFLGDNSEKNFISGIVVGYLLSMSIMTVPPPYVDKRALRIFDDITKEFNHDVAVLHLCESIEALSLCGDENSMTLFKALQTSTDKSVVDEAIVDLRELTNRLEA